MARTAPDVCPKCGGHEIRFSGFGTERVERELSRVFPRAQTGRMAGKVITKISLTIKVIGKQCKTKNET